MFQGSIVQSLPTTAAAPNLNMTYQKAPGGTNVEDPISTAFTDKAAPEELIAPFSYGFASAVADATGIFGQVQEFKHDIKAMRKLKKDDLLKLSGIASIGSSMRLIAAYSLWFKQ